MKIINFIAIDIDMSRVFCNYVTLKGKHATNCLNMSILLKYVHLKLKAYLFLTAILAINNVKIILHLYIYNKPEAKAVQILN